ncbi:PREDICTED: uncharacterized protein LOC106743698 [Dinoponera quadriceps]|uniref:Uncharacterized protein LOC106743698 n=1 Tax=Dinoponera quadriceps TaxID=609295 RepID=A0A6P3X4K7_DINQU|nr:PREDICTED: uncharacterized protein LOC106743698 [Dinoponera quadriceps]
MRKKLLEKIMNNKSYIEPIEPLHKERYEFSQENDKINGTVEFTNLTIHGLSNYSINEVQFTIEEQTGAGLKYGQFDIYKFRFETRFPSIQIFGIYNISATILKIPMLKRYIRYKRGYKMQANFEDVIANVSVRTTHRWNYVEEEHHYLNYVNMSFFDLRVAKVYLNDLDVDDLATFTLNTFLNNNLRTILDEMMPEFELNTFLSIQFGTYPTDILTY